MYQIVRSHEPQDVPRAFRSAFAVNSNALELIGSQSAPEPQIGSSERAELIQSGGEGRLVVVKFPGPYILVVALERRGILRHYHADTVSRHEITVGQMLDHLNDRPFVRSLCSPEHGLRHARKPRLEPGKELRHDRERITGAEEVQQCSDVGLGRGRGIPRGVGEGH